MLDVEAASTGTPSSSAPAPTPVDDDRRLAYLLSLLANAPDHRLTRGELNKKLRTRASEAAGLKPENVTPLIDRSSASGQLRVETTRRAVIYSLTETGVVHLNTVRILLPQVKQPVNRGRMIPPSSDQIRNHRTGYLLLAVLKASDQSLAESEATRYLDTYAREGLELNVPTARQLWRELAGQGLLVASGEKRSVHYTLSPVGRIKLANSEFPTGRIFPLSGETLNLLLEAAREVGKQFVSPPDRTVEPPARAVLESAILNAFEEYRRERHAVTGLVPLHEIRAEVRRTFGEAAARHDVFDDVVLELWRDKRIRLTPITDHARATPEQLQDAIPGVGEILFYLEAAHAPVAL